MSKYYFAYGSNLDKHAMRFRCTSASPVGRGVLEGYKLVFRGGAYGYLTVEPCEGSTVPIGVWKIDELDEHNLDLYEGYPGFYRKENIKIPVTRLKPANSSATEEIEGMIYLMNDGYKFARPTSDYIRTCMNGYADFLLDTNFLDKAVQEVKEKTKNIPKHRFCV